MQIFFIFIPKMLLTQEWTWIRKGEVKVNLILPHHTLWNKIKYDVRDQNLMTLLWLFSCISAPALQKKKSCGPGKSSHILLLVIEPSIDQGKSRNHWKGNGLDILRARILLAVEGLPWFLLIWKQLNKWWDGKSGRGPAEDLVHKSHSAHSLS